MLQAIRRFFGKQARPAPLGHPAFALLAEYAPKDLDMEIVTPGDPTHNHCFERAPWDRLRFGAPLADADPDFGTPLEFPMATFKDLFRCECGAEGIKSVRSLI